MKLWAVRCIDDKQAVGFFWAPSLACVRYMVDAVIDVRECEYRAISDPCAVTWEGPAPGLGVKRQTDEYGEECPDWDELSRTATFQFGFEAFLYDDMPDGWKPLRYTPQEDAA